MTLELTRQLAHDYSQTGEQEYLLRLAAEMPTGRFLDIGAGDGETFSNTRALALRGWGGMVVEPAAWAFDRLVDLYADTLVQPVCAVVTPDICGLVRLAYSKDDHLSSVDAAHVAKWARQVQFREVLAAAVPLAELMHAGPYSVVSIDAEGTTLDLLDAYRELPEWGAVRVVCYELEQGQRYTLPGREGWQQVGRTPNNAIFAR